MFVSPVLMTGAGTLMFLRPLRVSICRVTTSNWTSLSLSCSSKVDFRLVSSAPSSRHFWVRSYPVTLQLEKLALARLNLLFQCAMRSVKTSLE